MGNRVNPWRELAVLSLMVMELSWFVPWYRSLTPTAHATPPAWAFGVFSALILSVHLVVRAMNAIRLRLDVRRWVILLVFVSGFIAGLKALLYWREAYSVGELLNRPLNAFNDWTSLIPDEFLVGLAVLFACWRGIALAQELVGPATVIRTFQAGILLFIGYVFINTIVTGETPGAFLYLFLFASLIALGAGRVSVLSSLRGGGQNPFDRRWLVGMVMASTCVIGLAALIARLASGQVGIVNLIGTMALRLIAILVLLVISPLIYALVIISNNSPAVSDTARQLVNTLESLRTLISANAMRFGDLLGWMPNLRPVFFWSILIAAGFLVLTTISLWLFRERAGRQDEQQSLLEKGDLWKLVKEAIRNRLLKVGEGLAGMVRLRPGQRLLAAAHIRRIYAQLMDLCSQMGEPRPAAQTPLEFLPSMGQLFPELAEDLRTITQAYLRVRYGEYPETRREVDEVETAWGRLEVYGKEKVGKNGKH